MYLQVKHHNATTQVFTFVCTETYHVLEMMTSYATYFSPNKLHLISDQKPDNLDVLSLMPLICVPLAQQA